jgi:hypothetical protein
MQRHVLLQMFNEEQPARSVFGQNQQATKAAFRVMVGLWKYELIETNTLGGSGTLYYSLRFQSV